MVFQDALSSLNPVFPVGWQIAEMFRTHRGMNKSDALERAVKLMERVQIPAAKERVEAYPHQFSGGMRQRIMIAMATQIATRVLVLAHEAADVAAHRAEHRAMLAAVEGEQHVVALDMGAKLLESAGYEVLTLGANVPTSELPDVIADHSPALFALSATMPEAGTHVPAAVDAITEADDRIGLIIGGTSVPPALLPDPRVIVERSVAGIVDAADRLVRRAGLN